MNITIIGVGKIKEKYFKDKMIRRKEENRL